MEIKRFADVTKLEIYPCSDNIDNDRFRILFFCPEDQKWFWDGSKCFINDENSSALIIGLGNAEWLMRVLSHSVILKKTGNLTIENYNKRERELSEDLAEVHAEMNRIRTGIAHAYNPYIVSKDHHDYILEVIEKSIELKNKYDKLVNRPGIKVIDKHEEGIILDNLLPIFEIIEEPTFGGYIPDPRCTNCRENIKDWTNSEIKCGFKNTIFDNHDNWNCKTVSLIRQIVENSENDPGIQKYRCSESEQRYATISASNIPEFWERNEPVPMCLFITWYKNRGRTEGMYLMYDNDPPKPPTELECLLLITKYAKYLKG